MEVKIDKSFQKDTRKIKDQAILRKIVEIIRNVQTADNPQDIKNLKKLKGSPGNFRIEAGNYRIGIIFSENTVEFIRCLNRKDIYKYFPK